MDAEERQRRKELYKQQGIQRAASAAGTANSSGPSRPTNQAAPGGPGPGSAPITGGPSGTSAAAAANRQQTATNPRPTNNAANAPAAGARQPPGPSAPAAGSSRQLTGPSARPAAGSSGAGARTTAGAPAPRAPGSGAGTPFGNVTTGSALGQALGAGGPSSMAGASSLGQPLNSFNSNQSNSQQQLPSFRSSSLPTAGGSSGGGGGAQGGPGGSKPGVGPQSGLVMRTSWLWRGNIRLRSKGELAGVLGGEDLELNDVAATSQHPHPQAIRFYKHLVRYKTFHLSLKKLSELRGQTVGQKQELDHVCRTATFFMTGGHVDPSSVVFAMQCTIGRRMDQLKRAFPHIQAALTPEELRCQANTSQFVQDPTDLTAPSSTVHQPIKADRGEGKQWKAIKQSEEGDDMDIDEPDLGDDTAKQVEWEPVEGTLPAASELDVDLVRSQGSVFVVQVEVPDQEQTDAATTATASAKAGGEPSTSSAAGGMAAGPSKGQGQETGKNKQKRNAKLRRVPGLYLLPFLASGGTVSFVCLLTSRLAIHHKASYSPPSQTVPGILIKDGEREQNGKKRVRYRLWEDVPSRTVGEEEEGPDEQPWKRLRVQIPTKPSDEEGAGLRRQDSTEGPATPTPLRTLPTEQAPRLALAQLLLHAGGDWGTAYRQLFNRHNLLPGPSASGAGGLLQPAGPSGTFAGRASPSAYASRPSPTAYQPTPAADPYDPTDVLNLIKSTPWTDGIKANSQPPDQPPPQDASQDDDGRESFLQGLAGLAPLPSKPSQPLTQPAQPAQPAAQPPTATAPTRQLKPAKPAGYRAPSSIQDVLSSQDAKQTMRRFWNDLDRQRHKVVKNLVILAWRNEANAAAIDYNIVPLCHIIPDTKVVYDKGKDCPWGARPKADLVLIPEMHPGKRNFIVEVVLEHPHPHQLRSLLLQPNRFAWAMPTLLDTHRVLGISPTEDRRFALHPEALNAPWSTQHDVLRNGVNIVTDWHPWFECSTQQLARLCVAVKAGQLASEDRTGLLQMRMECIQWVLLRAPQEAATLLLHALESGVLRPIRDPSSLSKPEPALIQDTVKLMAGQTHVRFTIALYSHPVPGPNSQKLTNQPPPTDHDFLTASEAEKHSFFHGSVDEVTAFLECLYPG